MRRPRVATLACGVVLELPAAHAAARAHTVARAIIGVTGPWTRANVELVEVMISDGAHNVGSKVHILRASLDFLAGQACGGDDDAGLTHTVHWFLE